MLLLLDQGATINQPATSALRCWCWCWCIAQGLQRIPQSEVCDWVLKSEVCDRVLRSELYNWVPESGVWGLDSTIEFELSVFGTMSLHLWATVLHCKYMYLSTYQHATGIHVHAFATLAINSLLLLDSGPTNPGGKNDGKVCIIVLDLFNKNHSVLTSF